jgi:hypothetical protein
MSQAFEISITRDTATAAVAKLMASTTPRALGEVIFPDALELTQRRLAAYKNKKGFPSQGFGEQLAEKTIGAATDTGAKIVIHGQGARQLYYGGPIKAVNKKMLCFPIAAESYGKSMPEMFGGAIPPRDQRSAADKAKLKALRPLFAFTPSLITKPHPEIIPSKEELTQTAFASLHRALAGGFHS